MQSDQPLDPTRDRLLHAAGLEFAKRGFYEASVRSICAAANANVSAIKYHFGSKDDLYRAVIERGRAHMCRGGALPLMTEGDDPREALRRWMNWFLAVLLITEEQEPWVGEVLAHEMVRPTRFLDEFVEHTARPIRDELLRIVRRILPPSTPEHETGLLANALISLCASQKHSRQMLTRFGYPPPRSRAEVEALAKLLARFAIHGLTGFYAEGGRP